MVHSSTAGRGRRRLVSRGRVEGPTWIFTHGDGDGLCAGAISSTAFPDAEIFFTHPFGLLDDLRQVEGGCRVVICDVALAEDRLPELLRRFSEIEGDGELFYIDHHPLPEELQHQVPGEVVHRRGASASELAYSFFRPLSPESSRLAVYGAIADYLDRTPLIQRILARWERRILGLDAGILVQGIEGRRREYDFKKRLLTQLSHNTPPSSIEELVEYAINYTRLEESMIPAIRKQTHVHGLIAYTIDFPFSQGKTAIYARAHVDAKVGLAAERRKGMMDMSLRAVDKRVDLNSILRRLAPTLGGSGGGHPRAAGARIPVEKFDQFITDLDRQLHQTV